MRVSELRSTLWVDRQYKTSIFPIYNMSTLAWSISTCSGEVITGSDNFKNTAQRLIIKPSVGVVNISKWIWDRGLLNCKVWLSHFNMLSLPTGPDFRTPNTNRCSRSLKNETFKGMMYLNCRQLESQCCVTGFHLRHSELGRVGKIRVSYFWLRVV